MSVSTLLCQMDLSTRRKRRAAVNHTVSLLEKIIAAEQHYRDNLPPNLIHSVLYDNAEEYIYRFEEATELLRDAYDLP